MSLGGLSSSLPLIYGNLTILLVGMLFDKEMMCCLRTIFVVGSASLIFSSDIKHCIE